MIKETNEIVDRVPRYVPRTILCHMRVLPILQYNAYPKGSHPEGCPLVPNCVALELRTEKGSRWLGFEKAWINSELRMVISGFNSQDEVLSRWKIVPEAMRVGEPASLPEAMRA